MNKLLLESIEATLNEQLEAQESLVYSIREKEDKINELKALLAETEKNINEIQEFLDASKVNSKAHKTENKKSGQERIRAPEGNYQGIRQGNQTAKAVSSTIRKARTKS